MGLPRVSHGAWYEGVGGVGGVCVGSDSIAHVGLVSVLVHVHVPCKEPSGGMDGI